MSFLLVALSLAVAAGLALRNTFASDALAPAVATLMFATGACVALAAFAARRSQRAKSLVDLAGVVTMVGLAVAAMIEPEQMMRLTATSGLQN